MALPMQYPPGFNSKLQAKPICGVLAVAMAAGCDYELAHAACRRNMPAGSKRFGGRTYASQRDKAMLQLGVQFDKLDVPPVTLGAFMDRFANRQDTYTVEIAGHVVTFKGGFVLCQNEFAPACLSKYRRRRVKRVLRIIANQPQRLAA